MTDNQSRTINTDGGEYREINNQGTYVEGDYYNSPQAKQNLAEAAAEIQQLLKQLEQTYNPNDPLEQMQMATEVVKQIEANPDKKQRIISSLGAGSIAALDSLLNHPAATFIIAAIQKWKETQPKM